MVLTAPRAVNETERRICGSAAVSRPAVAEGLALRGRRAATLLAAEDSGPLGSDTASVRVAWVHHRAGGGPTSGFVFELAASSAQDAVDHCLVAHDLASSLGAPGVCTLASAGLDTLDSVELPGEASLRALDERRGGAAGNLADDTILERAEESFRRVSRETGRRVATVTVDGPDDADRVVVASGLARSAALEIVRNLESDGIRCRLVCVHLVRPFPAAALEQAVGGASRIWLVASDDAFVPTARLAMGRRAEVIDAPVARSRTAAAPPPLVLAARPAGPWGESLLLDAAARLAVDDGVALTVRGDLLVAAETGAAVPPVEDLAIDVALCAHPAYLECGDWIDRMNERGALVLVASGPPDDWWDGLAVKTRSSILDRELSVHWLDLSAAAGLDPADALLAAAGRGRADAASSSLTRLDAHALEAARDKTAGPPPRPLPRMPAAPKDADGRWRDEARRFHLTGNGAHSSLEPTPAEPLHPLVLDALEPDDAETARPLDESELLALYAAAVREVRRRRWEALRDEIVSLTLQLDNRVARDEGRAPGNLSVEALGASLGADAASFLDAEKLAVSLRRQRGARRLDDRRRERIREALAVLQRGINHDIDTDVILVCPDAAPRFDVPPGVRTVVHPRGSGAAIGLFEGLADDYTELFRALRVARLEVDDAYDPELHDAPLARLEWQGLGEEELLALPRLAVLETDTRLRGAGLGALAELLRSGRPVHVLVVQSTSEFRAAESWQGLAGFHPGLGYLAVAHREAFVVESSLLRPERLERDLRRMASSLRPGAAFVAVPNGQATVTPRLQLAAVEQARAVPCFSYDPEAGPNWAERFDLADNPQVDRPWPLHGVRYLDEAGEEAKLEQAFTFAHAVALDPSYRRHFRIVPEEAWSAEQMELGEYLAAAPPAVARKIPYLWVVRGDRLGRALITRELAYAARDRQRAWHILQELAGTDNEYARRAAEQSRTEASEQAALRGRELESEHTTDLDRARSEAVREAIERLARRLVGVEGGALPEDPAQTAVAAPEAAAPTNGETTTAAPPQAAAPAAAITDAYIDTALCTSCADCINVNPRLFKYDENKQAFIADIHAGTYAQLVKAAEKCPARCIHPGAPLAGDKTATDTLLARAAKFN